MDLVKKINNLRNLINDIEKKGIDLSKSFDVAKSFYNFKEKKQSYYIASFEGSFNDLKKAVISIAKECSGDVVIELMLLWKEAEKNKKDMKKLKDVLDKIEKVSSRIRMKEKLSIKIPFLPDEIKSDVTADLQEIEKCFNSGLYRSAVILCGRVLEAALHRKYYEATGFDILEKNPGIGLGNLIAKLKEKNIDIDPGLTQQIHLINQVRIFSVHKKQKAFMPSREQAYAIILYTVDVLHRMW